MWKYRWLVGLLIMTNIFFLTGSLWVIQQKGGSKWLMNEILQILSKPRESISYAESRQDILNVLPVTSKDTVFLGDSIFDYAEWHELIGFKNIKNRAVSGSDISYLLDHIGSIMSANPRNIFLEIGVNNVLRGESPENIIREYMVIIKLLLEGAKDTDIWILPIFPIHQGMYETYFLAEYNMADIPQTKVFQRINNAIKEMTLYNPLRVHFVEMNNLLNDEGELSSKYTLDGVHLNGLGLLEVAKKLKKILVSKHKTP